jgi:serine/threonine protein kinase
MSFKMECLRNKFAAGVVLNGRYETISPLNHGSFGMVFMAKDLKLDQTVALKCMTKKSAANLDESCFAVDEKSEELACHSRLGSHPNIVNLIDHFETDAHFYLVLEFCARGDLYEAIRTGCGPLETEHVRDFMLELVDAVEHLHSKGVYHRDIKPENIFLSESGALKLGDFGLATTDEWTYENAVGSDRYMSPEQYDSSEEGYETAQADIWAIGVCLLNILFSRNPFTKPTEEDPLFRDFSFDMQTLFDVFPMMSQDTFEVIAQCMSLDPRKRSLAGVRSALLRAVTFTTDDESLDEFCTMHPGIASANREPLRTPSIQSPQVGQDSFPWAKALKASPPQQFRQLSVIQDDEPYDEDLFATSATSSGDWFSVGPQTPSMASVLESSFGNSLKSSAWLSAKRPGLPRTNLTPISGSLPITMTKPKLTHTMSSVFGKKDMVSKSWSDMWDEDLEDEDDHEQEIRDRQAQNARTWSHESKTDVPETRVGLSEPKSDSFVNIKSLDTEVDGPGADIDGDIVVDGFFFQDTTMKIRQPSPPRYSPPSKRTLPALDKWAALGERRRAHGATTPQKSNNIDSKFQKKVGLGFSGFGAGAWDMKVHQKEKTATCPWVRGKNGEYHQHHAKVMHTDLGDLEWVGGWPHYMA